MKQFKKLFAGVIALCMLFIFMPAVMAEDTVTYSLQGETNIFAPPVGQLAEIPYTIVNDSTKEAIPTTITISGEPDGVVLNDSKTALLVSGNSVKSGTFTVTATATNGGIDPITKTVTVEEYRIYEDFESQTENSKALVYATKLSDPTVKQNVQNGSSVTIAKDDDNYVNATADWGSYYLEIKPENYSVIGQWSKARNLTLEFDVKGYVNSSYAPVVKDATNGTFNVGVQNYYICYKPTSSTDTSGIIWTQYPNSWTRMKLILDYYTRQFTLYVNGTKYGPYDMLKDTGAYPVTIRFVRPIDNLAIYSGKPATKKIGTINGDEKLFAPPEGVKSALQYTFLDGETVLNDATWSTEGSLAGVTVKNNGRLILDGGSIETNGSVTLVAQTDFVKATKTITLLNERIFEDFEGQEEGKEATFSFLNLDGTSGESKLTQNTVKVAVEGENEYFSPDGTNKYGGLLFGWGSTDFINAIKSTKVTTLSYKAKGDAKAISGSGTRFVVEYKDGSFKANGDNALGKVAESGWTEVRVVFDYTNADAPTYKLYIDDTLAAKDVPVGYFMSGNDNFGYRFRDLYFYSDMDDFAYYSGEKIVEDYLTVDDTAYTSGSVLSSGSHTVKARLGNLGTGSKKLFMAHYNGNVLQKISALTSNYAEMAARLDNISGGDVRIFLWDGALVPIEITSIPTTVN